MNGSPVAAIILAAGKGTRMKSDLPKGLQPLGGVPMVELSGRALKEAGVERPIVVVGHGGEAVMAALGDGYDYVWQREQKGTGHAAMMAADLLAGWTGPVLVALGDTPLVDADVFRKLLKEFETTEAACVFTAAVRSDPTGYGRIIRGPDGHAERIVEQNDCSPEQKAIREVHCGMYCFDAATLLETFPKLTTENAQEEYYLTDTIMHIAASGKRVVPCFFDDEEPLTGVNDRWALAKAEKKLVLRKLRKLALEGVTFQDIDSTYVGLDVEIGVDAVIGPGTTLLGRTTIGAGSNIGPNTRISDSTIGAGTTVLMSNVDGSVVGDGVCIGPFAHLRGGAAVGDESRIGNFVELKNSELGRAVKVSHLSYIGDASIGEDANIGAGTITCNYDGYAKHRTEIGARAFVGSNSTLVAPVTIGEGALIAAGSVVTRSVPDDALGIARTPQEVKEGWVSKWRSKKEQA